MLYNNSQIVMKVLPLATVFKSTEHIFINGLLWSIYLILKAQRHIDRMNECLMTPQLKMKIGYWVSDKW